MTPSLKSKQGCWTCKLRKKKCDERHPRCSLCDSLSISCYGYGPKPDWMDGGDRENAVANGLKEVVKHTSRHKGSQAKRSTNTVKIAPKPTNDFVEISVSDSVSTFRESSAATTDASSLQQNVVDTQELDVSKEDDPLMPCPVSTDDAVPLMHFVDTVFALQFPMYKPGIRNGGRGWLLVLLLRTKPFYRAALATSLHFYRTVMFAEMSPSARVASLLQQETHLKISMGFINQLAQGSCPRNGLGFLFSVVQLGFYELFTGNSKAWKAHFFAAMNMHKRGINENLAHFDLAREARTIISEDLPLSENHSLVQEYVMTFRFLDSTIIWVDIVSSITAGTAPFHHTRIIAFGTETKLDEIMGCENWVMLQIGRIAMLNDQKNQALRQGNFTWTELEQIATDISRTLELGLSQEAFQSHALVESTSGTTFDSIQSPQNIISHVFALVAVVYLHLVIHGFQNMELLDRTILKAVEMLQVQTPTNLLPAMVLPLFLIGCVARECEKSFFRKVLSSAPLRDPFFKNREGILLIIEEVWNKRQINTSLAWKDILELTGDVLLL